MKIAAFVHLDELSGACLATLQVALHLAKSGCDVTFITPKKGRLYKRAQEFGTLKVVALENPDVSFAGAGFIKKLNLLRARLNYIFHTRRYLKQNSFQKVYIGSTASLFSGVSAFLAGIPIVWHVHEVIEERGAFTKIKLKAIAAMGKKFLFASHRSRDSFPETRHKPSLVVKNYINVHQLAEEPYSPVSDPFIIVSNGMFRRKGADILLRAVIKARQICPDFSPALRLIGSDEGRDTEFTRTVKELAENPLLQNRVAFLGVLENVPAELRQGSVYISASRNEALPIILIEAMAIGIPIVSTDVGDCGILLQNGILGLVIPPESPDELAKAILSLWKDYSAAATRAKKAQEQIMTDYGSPTFWDPVDQFIRLD